MKRLFGLIGLTYLSVLTVVYYFYSDITLTVVAVGSIILICFGVTAKLFLKSKHQSKNFIVIGATALSVCIAFSLYMNIVYLPLVEIYSEQEVFIEGYVCDERHDSSGYYISTIQTEKINGNPKKLKFEILTNDTPDLNISDCVKGNALLHTVDYDLSKSNGVFFVSYQDKVLSVNTSGDNHNNLQTIASKIRLSAEKALDSQLDSSSADLSQAILLGNKYSLSNDIRNDFSNTGTSFLIVVSGLHLSIVTALFIKIIKQFTNNNLLIFIFTCVIVVAFMLVTGFNPSVIRSGIMTIIAYGAKVLLRYYDSLNAIGIAALAITLPNPFAVGNIGLLLSFAATMGIILWSNKLYYAILARIRLANKSINPYLHLQKPFVIQKIEFMSSRHLFLKGILNSFCVSFSASIWILPITTIAFGRVSPYVVIVAVILEPAVSLLITSILLLLLLYFIFASTSPLFALICQIISGYITFTVGAFSSIPYCSVKVDESYFYIWIILSIILVIIGYIIKAKKGYIIRSALFSVSVFIIGYSIFTFVSCKSSSLTVYKSYSGAIISVENKNNISFISYNSSDYNNNRIMADIIDNYSSPDYIILPSSEPMNYSYYNQLPEEFDYSSILLYYNIDKKYKLSSDYKNVHTFIDNSSLLLNLNEQVTDEIICIDGVTYQYISGQNSTVLFTAAGADISKLPDKYRQADYFITNSLPENLELLNCDNAIYITTDINNKNYSLLSENFDNIETNKTDNITIRI